MSDSALIVAIDGPAASGKSTVAKLIAKELGIVFVSSGGMYRAFTWCVLENGVDPAATAEVISLLEKTVFAGGQKDGLGTFAVDGRFLSREELSVTEVNANVSAIAAIPEVRARLVAEQRAYAEANGVVMEGRDIGSVVFPETPFKFYIDASPEVREQRRRAEGINDSIADRDKTDSNRKASPLVIPEDAIVVDSSDLTIDQVVARVIEEVQSRRA